MNTWIKVDTGVGICTFVFYTLYLSLLFWHCLLRLKLKYWLWSQFTSSDNLERIADVGNSPTQSLPHSFSLSLFVFCPLRSVENLIVGQGNEQRGKFGKQCRSGILYLTFYTLYLSLPPAFFSLSDFVLCPLRSVEIHIVLQGNVNQYLSFWHTCSEGC